jgi:serine/threonine-protein kinase PknG
MTCTQPGCTGTIDGGYCDQCGAPANGAPPPSAAATGSSTPTSAPTEAGPAPAGAPAADGSPCSQPGCTGTIDGGYCNQCGAPASGVAAPTADGSGLSSRVSARLSGRESSATASARLGSTPLGSARARAGSRPTHRIGTASSASSRLGAGLTVVEPAPVSDPLDAVMTNPMVAESKRFCGNCGKPVGRGRDDQPGRTEGFCPSCGTAFSFTPKLQPGEVVGNQYVVVGAIAHGGLGWIYLATDRNVSDRYVVLKGLLNTGDREAYEAAVAERQFLAQVSHPLIVEIYNFAEDQGEGYTVMEYVGGRSLKQLLKSRTEAAGHYDPFPAATAIAFMIEILPAFSYLHASGIIYCDFKPDNLIQTGDGVKLIDLGGVRRADDNDSAIYGTVGYQAPEVPADGPSVAGDIYTIGRTLMVCATEFRGYQDTYVASLPDLSQVELFQQYDSLRRFITKACAAKPDDRFLSADEMRDQLLGVLRQVVAFDAGTTVARTAATSTLFLAPGLGALAPMFDLPELIVDAADPGAVWVGQLSVTEPAERRRLIEEKADDGSLVGSAELYLALARACAAMGDAGAARQAAEQVLTIDPWDWRGVWMHGLASLVEGDAAAAVVSFNTVADQIPGESAPRFALGLAAERAGNDAVAAELYASCAASDADYAALALSALARVRSRGGDLDGALAALALVPTTSASYTGAAATAVELHVRRNGPDDFAQAAAATARVADGRTRTRLEAMVLTSVLRARDAGVPVTGAVFGASAADESALRGAAEDAWRRLAQQCDSAEDRWRCIDAANAVRPRTLL